MLLVVAAAAPEVAEVLGTDGELTATVPAVAAEVGVELAIEETAGATLALLSLLTAVAVTGDDVVDAEGVTSGSDEATAGMESGPELTDVVETVPAVPAMEEDGERMIDSAGIGSPILATTGELV